MILNFNFLPVNDTAIDNKIVNTDYNPKIGDVIDFTEHLRNIGLIELPSSFEVKDIDIRLDSGGEIEHVIHCEPHHADV